MIIALTSCAKRKPLEMIKERKKDHRILKHQHSSTNLPGSVEVFSAKPAESLKRLSSLPKGWWVLASYFITRLLQLGQSGVLKSHRRLRLEMWGTAWDPGIFLFFYSWSAWSWVIHYSTHTHTITPTWSYTTAYLPKSCPHFGTLNAALMQNALLFHNRLKNIISWFVKADICFTPPRKAIRQCHLCGQ